eukprot:Platyproteum_vivax@DN341_c0_g1_i1.p1
MSRTMNGVFDDYQKSRIQFVQTVADLANRPQNIENLQNAGAIQLLRPLLIDSVPSVQQSAAVALGRMAGHSSSVAEAVIDNQVLPHLVASLTKQNRFYKKAAAGVLRSVAKHSPELAQTVVSAGAVEPLVECLEQFDAAVKEAAAWALGHIARHTPELALAVADAGAVQLFALLYREPELTLKRVAASCLADIAKHNTHLAQIVVDTQVLTLMAVDLDHLDSVLKRHICSCLGHVAKHGMELAEIVVDQQLFPALLYGLKDTDTVVEKAAAICLREIVSQSPDLAKVVLNAGGVEALSDFLVHTKGNIRMPGVLALGYIAAFSESLALAVIAAKTLPTLKDALITEKEPHLQGAVAWTLGQIGRHTAAHARALAELDIPRRLLHAYLQEKTSEDLKQKSKEALKAIIDKTTHLAALEPLVPEAPPNILKHLLAQFAKILPKDLEARRSFVQSGGLQRIQAVEAEVGTELRDSIAEVNALFPKEVIDYFSPNYTDALLKKVNDFKCPGA